MAFPFLTFQTRSKLGLTCRRWYDETTDGLLTESRRFGWRRRTHQTHDVVTGSAELPKSHQKVIKNEKRKELEIDLGKSPDAFVCSYHFITFDVISRQLRRKNGND